MLLKRLSVVAIETEATSGTAETLVSADSNFNIYNATTTPNIETRERLREDSFSTRRSSVGPRSGSITFMVDITGDGAAGVPTWAAELLPACGFVNNSGTFEAKAEAPGSNVKTLTIGHYENGRKKLLYGCAGNVKFILQSGQDAMAEFTFTGVWGGVTDEAMPSPTYPSDVPLRFAGSTITLGGVTPCVQQVEVDAGNNVVLREDATNATGFKSAIVSDRKVVGTLDPEAELVATKDVYGNWLAGTEEALTIEVEDASDKMTLSMPKAQITTIADGERNQLRTDQISFKANFDSAANDELTIAFGAP